MTWGYKQSTGELTHDGMPVTTGYSGFANGKNNPSMQNVPDVGPIPVGAYHIEKARDTDTHGPLVMPLTPLQCTNTCGRSGFLIHGDSIEHPGSASRGCIILPRTFRDMIAVSGDTTLEVIA